MSDVRPPTQHPSVSSGSQFSTCGRDCPDQGHWPLLSPVVTSLLSSPFHSVSPHQSTLLGTPPSSRPWTWHSPAFPPTSLGPPHPRWAHAWVLWPLPSPIHTPLGGLVHSQGGTTSLQMTHTVLPPARASSEFQIWRPANPQGVHNGGLTGFSHSTWPR